MRGGLDGHGLVGEHALEVVDELLGLAGAEVRVRVLVVPDEDRLPVLDGRTVRRLPVEAHHRLCDLLPAAIGSSDAGLPLCVPPTPLFSKIRFRESEIIELLDSSYFLVSQQQIDQIRCIASSYALFQCYYCMCLCPTKQHCEVKHFFTTQYCSFFIYKKKEKHVFTRLTQLSAQQSEQSL